MTFTNEPKRIVWMVAGASGLLGIAIVACGIHATSTDDFLRAYLAALWSKNRALSPLVAAWPPLYSVIYGSAMKLPLDPYWIAHGVTAIFTGLTVWVAGRLAAWLANDEWAGPVAAIWVATSPLQIFLSFSMLSEPLYGLLLLLFLSAIFRWLENASRAAFALASILCFFMSMLRIEAWAWGGILLLLALIKDRTPRTLLLGALPNLFPLIWLVTIDAVLGGGPFRLFREQAAEVAKVWASVPDWRWIPLRTVLFHFSPAIIVFLAALRRFEKWPKKYRMAWAVGAAFWVWQLGVLRNNLMAVFPERSVAVPGLFTWVLAAAGLLLIVRDRNAGSRRIGPLFFACVTGVVINLASLPLLSVTYDRNLTAIGERFRGSKTFETETRVGGIGSDILESPLSHVAMTSGVAKRFRKVWMNAGHPMIPSPEPPRTFLLASEGLANALKIKLPGARMARIGPFWLVSGQPQLFKELHLTPERN